MTFLDLGRPYNRADHRLAVSETISWMGLHCWGSLVKGWQVDERYVLGGVLDVGVVWCWGGDMVTGRRWRGGVRGVCG